METKIVTLPSKAKATLKSWLTGRESRALRNVYLKNANIGMAGTEAEIKGITGALVEEEENLAIQTVVIDLDGNSEDILNRALSLRDTDFNALLEAVREVTSNKGFLA